MDENNVNSLENVSQVYDLSFEDDAYSENNANQESNTNNAKSKKSKTDYPHTFTVRKSEETEIISKYIHFSQMREILNVAQDRTIEERLRLLNIPYSKGSPKVVRVSDIVEYLLGRQTTSRNSKNKSTNSIELERIQSKLGGDAFDLGGFVHLVDPIKMKAFQDATKVWIENQVKMSVYVQKKDMYELLSEVFNNIISYFPQLQARIDDLFEDRPDIQQEVAHWINNVRYDLYKNLKNHITEYKYLAPDKEAELKRREDFVAKEMVALMKNINDRDAQKENDDEDEDLES